MRFRVLLLALALTSHVAHAQAAQRQDTVARVDSLFSRLTASTPGCAVGVSRHGRTVLARAYGMANLEYDVPLTTESIIEAGSVAKQFTAAAVLLLAQQGKLSIDDPVRKHIPELADYGAPLTIRHMLNHTSGLRDWGTVAAVEGWPRGSRVHTHDHVLDIVTRQRSLNFPPGREYLYSNTGYNLLAIIVQRVSGRSFADFTRTEIFEPLGMARTSWRDDYTRVVKGRATAYSPTRTGFRLNMPFENVHGNGGLLTTVEDLLRWSANFDAGHVGGPALLREQVRPGRLTSGREIEYAAGLGVSRYRGVPQVSHSGATAGYRAFLARYPDQGLAVAVLCNHAGAPAVPLGHRVADLFLGAAATDPAPPKTIALAPEVLAARAGLYRNTVTWEPLRISVRDGKLIDNGGTEAVALSPNLFHASNGGRALFDVAPDGRTRALRLLQEDGDTLLFLPVEPWTPAPGDLAPFAGTYTSDEAAASFTIVQQAGKLLLRQRPTVSFELQPRYRDVFEVPTGDIIRFVRDDSGKVIEMSVFLGRVRDLRFQRQ
ncbi:MAG TPA: serine hydrolase domain-containing protein [Gemmatimonadaceae bacterium]|nr:serine hydrolase domain-containing protein [Gemmatimonadaceae bacterium]